ncbi:hypothetical protein TNCV_4866511 [Trichonephila clavipes]|nr:hypothetical protein TNCV_4866511 [Trichonephila clavipes]
MFKVIELDAKREIRSFIRFLTARNMSSIDIHRHVTEVYGTEAMSESKVRKWFRKFKDGLQRSTERLTNTELADMHLIYGLVERNARTEETLHWERRFLLGVWTVNSPQSHIVRVYDAGHGKSGVFHSAEWHDGDWSSDGIREAWLWFFIWVESF